MTIDPQDIKVQIKLLKEGGKTLAQANITLFDCWVEKGWRIMSSDHFNQLFQEHLWIQSPCYRAGPTWKEMVYIDDRKLFEKLQEKIYDQYKLAKYKEPQDTANEAEKIFINEQTKQADEIPF